MTEQPTPEQMEAIEHKAVDLANIITPILMQHPPEIVGATLGKLAAGWLATYRLGDEKYADLNQRAHEGRATILTRWMVGVLAEVPDLMKRIDEDLLARRS